MTIISKLFGLSTKTLKNKGVVSSADILAGKIKINGWHMSPEKSLMFRSAQADEFIKSAQKQNANILSDNVLYFEGCGFPYRVITKRLPSGTTVAKAYSQCGIMTYKEVKAINGSKSLTIYTPSGNGSKVWSFIQQDKTGAGTIAPGYYCYSQRTIPFSAISKPDLQQLGLNADKLAGMTELSNSNNANYQALKSMNLVK